MTWKEKVVDEWEILDEETFEALYLTSRDTSVPIGWEDDDINKTIFELFYYPLSVIRDEVAPDAVVTIEPSYEDTTFYEISDLDTLRILYYDWKKAWHFHFDTVEDFENWCQNIADLVKERLTSSALETLKTIHIRPHLFDEAKLIKQVLKEKGWTQAKLATEIGVSEGYISKILYVDNNAGSLKDRIIEFRVKVNKAYEMVKTEERK